MFGFSLALCVWLLVLGNTLTFWFIDLDVVAKSIGAFQQQLVSATSGRCCSFVWPRPRFSALFLCLRTESKSVLASVILRGNMKWLGLHDPQVLSTFYRILRLQKEEQMYIYQNLMDLDPVFRTMGSGFKERNVEEAEEEEEEEEEEGEKTAKELDDEIKRKKERQVSLTKN